MKHEENGQLPKKNCEECIVSQKQLVAKLSQVTIALLSATFQMGNILVSEVGD